MSQRNEINLNLLKNKDTIIYFLKKPNSRTHYILWWDNLEYLNSQKSFGKKCDEANASLIIEDDVESYINYYLKKGYNLYKESELKLNISGTERKG